MILINEETVTIRYTVKFEKRVKAVRKDNEEHHVFIDRIAKDLTDDEATEGDVLHVDNIEEMYY